MKRCMLNYTLSSASASHEFIPKALWIHPVYNSVGQSRVNLDFSFMSVTDEYTKDGGEELSPRCFPFLYEFD